MKYLVQHTPKPPSAQPLDDPLSLDKVTVAYIMEMQKKDTLELGYALTAGGGVGILEVASHEELWEILFAYPNRLSFHWQVEPLADVAHAFGKAIAILEQEVKK